MIPLETKRSFRTSFRLGILSAAWGRSVLTGTFLEYYARITGVDLVLMMVWSQEDEDPPPSHPLWEYDVAPNQPLGKKWNTGVRALMDMDVDAIMILGSDDFVSMGYLATCIERLKRGMDIISARELYIYRPGDDVVAYCQGMVPGAGRCISRRVMNLMHGRLWDDDAQGYLDSSITHRMAQIDAKRSNLRGSVRSREIVLDVKTPDGPCMWSFQSSESETGRTRHMLVNEKSSTLLNIRRVIWLPARQFFSDHFPSFTNYAALGTDTPYEQEGTHERP